MRISSKSQIAYTPMSLTVDKIPWFPVMGEMHYSRYPADGWEDELNKMKAGGVDVVSLYVIWIHHEEIEGQFDFDGCRDLHRFLETIQECGLYCILRIGPWAHGEARNGGFPDWLLEKSRSEQFAVRTDDPAYLKYVRRFYEHIFEQAEGMMIRDNGPVIGVQIENEYGHVGGQTGEAGEQHMRTLQQMARQIGFEVPVYTATGWGGAVTGGMIPVMGGYCEAPWDQRLTEIEPSGNYIFTEERNDHNIGSDHGIGEGITFDMKKFPYLTAELGGGLQVTHHRRPVATGHDIGAMSMVKLGSGVSLLGYYMYHGGTNPKGKLTTLQESRATGYPNDLPVLSYDFNAPIREYGQITDTFREIRLLALFVHDFGEELCRMPYVSQPGNPRHPEDLKHLRSAVRYVRDTDESGNERNHGYLFINNYQRHYPMAVHRQEKLSAYAEDGTVLAEFPKAADIKDGEYFFWPFNLPVGRGLLKTAMATPLCILHGAGTGGGNAYVFYTEDGRDPEYETEGNLQGNIFITLSRQEALHAAKIMRGGREYLIISEQDVITDTAGDMQLICPAEGSCRPSFRVWPDMEISAEHFEKIKKAAPAEQVITAAYFAGYESAEELHNKVKCSFTPEQGTAADENDGSRTYRIRISQIPEDAEEIYLQIGYEGDSAEMFCEEDMIADSFYTGQKWEIGLKRFIDENGRRTADRFEAAVSVHLLKQGDGVYLEKWPPMEDGCACRITDISAVSQYRVRIF